MSCAMTVKMSAFLVPEKGAQKGGSYDKHNYDMERRLLC